MIALFLIAAVSGPPAETKPPAPRTAVEATLVVKVSDKDQAADAIIADAEKRGGYFARRTDDEVVLKVPVAAADGLIDGVEALGVVVDKSFNARDVGARLGELRTRLKSRQDVFARYFQVLDTASISSIVEVESEMTQLVQEIEQLKGAIQLIEHKLQLAQITVRFRFRDRRPPARDGSSSFAWLNTVNLADLLGVFAHE